MRGREWWMKGKKEKSRADWYRVILSRLYFFIFHFTFLRGGGWMWETSIVIPAGWSEKPSRWEVTVGGVLCDYRTSLFHLFSSIHFLPFCSLHPIKCNFIHFPGLDMLCQLIVMLPKRRVYFHEVNCMYVHTYTYISFFEKTQFCHIELYHNAKIFGFVSVKMGNKLKLEQSSRNMWKIANAL